MPRAVQRSPPRRFAALATNGGVSIVRGGRVIGGIDCGASPASRIDECALAGAQAPAD